MVYLFAPARHTSQMINNQLFVELSEDDEPYSFKLVFHGPNDRSFTLGAENQEIMEEWMKAIAAASYDYMKLLVMELQRQVDELTGKLFQVIISLLSTLVLILCFHFPEMERLKKLGLDGEAPIAPPRHRHNPFNAERDGSMKRTPMKKLTFGELHALYGASIVEAREKWLKSQQAKTKSTLSEDILITL